MKTDDCLDVRKLASGKWRVKRNPDADKYSRDAWDFHIVGSRGHICPWGGNMLACCVDGHRGICASLSREPWVTEVQYGDDGINAVFDVEHLDKAAKYIKTHKKRTINEQARAAASARLAKLRQSAS